MTDDGQGQNAAVLHALTVGTFKRNVAANLQVVFLWSFFISHCSAAGVVGCVLLQHITSADHHSCCLKRDGEEE